jgi:methionine-S-sulfoxide reductase
LKPLRLSKYKSSWKEDFEKIKNLLDGYLTSLIIDIIHVGSTSVEGMTAKPIIDIDIIYENHFQEIIKVLEKIGYTYEGTKGIDHRHAFKMPSNYPTEHHLYLIENGALPLKNHLMLKRALQMSSNARKKYSYHKIQLLKRNKFDRNLYTESKTEIINQILKEEFLMKSIVFAGGCFWGVEAYFKQIKGVSDTEVGYINGNGETSYEEVCRGSGHAEAVLVRYDEDIVSLKKLLDHLFNIIDPTSINKQGNDVGVQYRTGIYNYTPDQLPFIHNYLNIRAKEYHKPLQIELATDLTFFVAEDYHQDYLAKNKNGYCHIDLGSYKNVE